MTDATTTQTRLDEAEAALHKLSLGAATVSISVDGRSVTYNAANLADLRIYIGSLRRELGLTSGRRGALTPLWFN